MMPGIKMGCIILGSGGLVSQRFQQRLSNHPFFEILGVVGSPTSTGKQLSELPWHLDENKPILPDLIVIGMEEGLELAKRNDIQVIFSALPSSIAAEKEPLFVETGCTVYSNASYHRMEPTIPLVIPEVNEKHLILLDIEKHGIICSTNCTVMPIALTVNPIFSEMKIKRISIQTEQSVSGGGIELLKATKSGKKPSPEIPGEAQKIEEELIRLLSTMEGKNEIKPSFVVDVSCKRVEREFGHIVHIEIETLAPVTQEWVMERWTDSVTKNSSKLPSSPKSHIIIQDTIIPETDRWAGSSEIQPDPAKNLDAGMAIVTTIPEVEDCIIRWTSFSENTIRGAAGGCVLLAELDSIRRGWVS